MRREKLFSLPNKVTFVRFLFSLLLIPVLYPKGKVWAVAGATVFLVASLSDFIDGYIAREGDVETTFGKIMDPVADKALVATGMVMLVRLGRLPAWIASVILVREFFISGLRLSASKLKKEIKVSKWGKLKTFLQMASLIFLILHYPFLGINFHKLGMFLIYITLFITLYSGYLYTLHFMKEVEKAG